MHDLDEESYSPYEEPPFLSLANVRPYVSALILHKGYVVRHDVVATITPHCNIDDLRVGGVDPFDRIEYDGSRLEKLADQVIGEFVNDGILEWNEGRAVWSVTALGLGRTIRWCVLLNAALPQDINQERGREYQ